MKHTTTHPSRYYERQAPAQAPVVLEYQQVHDNEAIAAIIGAAVWGFALGMVVIAAWAGVL